MICYLHINGCLIGKDVDPDDFKRDAEESDFVVQWWDMEEYGLTPEAFFAFLMEAKSNCARIEDLKRLADAAKLDKARPLFYKIVLADLPRILH